MAREAEGDGVFEFCYFEKEHIDILPGCTTTESIFSHFGDEFDAFFLFFRDTVGPGTRAEFDRYCGVLKDVNPNCQLWWRQVHCENHDESATELLTDLHKPGGNFGLQRHDLAVVDTPERLANLFVAKLLNTSAALRDGRLSPFSALGG